mmetsp:Transcript_29720/g.86581  ORF Transcript_29720/g.86581 Transcript_29720/m.86581 type:complete len:278 (+) Transcript_29720:345-1178(+)
MPPIRMVLIRMVLGWPLRRRLIRGLLNRQSSPFQPKSPRSPGHPRMRPHNLLGRTVPLSQETNSGIRVPRRPWRPLHCPLRKSMRSGRDQQLGFQAANMRGPQMHCRPKTQKALQAHLDTTQLFPTRLQPLQVHRPQHLPSRLPPPLLPPPPPPLLPPSPLGTPVPLPPPLLRLLGQPPQTSKRRLRRQHLAWRAPRWRSWSSISDTSSRYGNARKKKLGLHDFGNERPPASLRLRSRRRPESMIGLLRWRARRKTTKSSRADFGGPCKMWRHANAS